MDHQIKFHFPHGQISTITDFNCGEIALHVGGRITIERAETAYRIVDIQSHFDMALDGSLKLITTNIILSE